eukprot:tig00001215_g7569.t1
MPYPLRFLGPGRLGLAFDAFPLRILRMRAMHVDIWFDAAWRVWKDTGLQKRFRHFRPSIRPLIARQLAAATAAIVLLLAALFLLPTRQCGGAESWAVAVYFSGHPTQSQPPDWIEPTLDCRTPVEGGAVTSHFVADPFLAASPDAEGALHLFVEVLDGRRRRGAIAVSNSSDWGTSWGPLRVVLQEPFHLSYPYVFEGEDGARYMIPETYERGEVRLYRAAAFPERWELAAVLLRGEAFVDASVVRHGARWFMFVAVRSKHAYHRHVYDTLLYHSERLEGPWLPHRLSPIYQLRSDIGRPAGRVLSWSEGGRERVVRFVQEDGDGYGRGVRALEVTRLTPDDFEEGPAPGPPFALRPSRRPGHWAALRAHHVDALPLVPGRWLVASDGSSR